MDRQVDLEAAYRACKPAEAKLRVKISGELRLLEAALARLIKSVPTDLAEPPTKVSQKASHAANVRWQRNAQA